MSKSYAGKGDNDKDYVLRSYPRIIAAVDETQKKSLLLSDTAANIYSREDTVKPRWVHHSWSYHRSLINKGLTGGPCGGTQLVDPQDYSLVLKDQP